MQSFAGSSKWLAAVLSPEILITSLSPGAEQFTGFSAQELLGQPITQILADSTAFEMPRILSAVEEWGHWEGGIVHRARGGKLLEASGILSSLAGNGDDAPGYLLVSSLNRSLALDECERSAVAQIGANLRGFAHDLNNPLAVIMGFAQLLILNADCQGEIRSDIEKVYSELKRVTQVVERLHRYALSLHTKPQQDQTSRAVGEPETG
jgi:nitrogen-specific signal transduction histidine kinase